MNVKDSERLSKLTTKHFQRRPLHVELLLNQVMTKFGIVVFKVTGLVGAWHTSSHASGLGQMWKWP
jgi:hypothetical protein